MNTTEMVHTCARMLLLAAIALAAAPFGLRGQGEERIGRGYFQVGYQAVELSDLNARLASRGIPEFSDGFLTLGGGGHVERGRFLIGGEGHALIEKTETTTDFQRKLSGGMGFFDVGVVLGRRPRARLYPFVGVGGGGMSLKTTERSSPSFDQVLDDPRRGSTVTVGALLMQVGAGLEVIARSSTVGRGGLGIGVRGGYIFAPATGEWSLDGTDLANGPDLDLTGFYLRFSIGGFGGRR